MGQWIFKWIANGKAGAAKGHWPFGCFRKYSFGIVHKKQNCILCKIEKWKRNRKCGCILCANDIYLMQAVALNSAKKYNQDRRMGYGKQE